MVYRPRDTDSEAVGGEGEDLGHESACPAQQQMIDIELADRSAQEIAGAYRALCCMILLRTVQAVGKTVMAMRERKIEVRQKRAAERWVRGRVGTLPFESVCEAFDMDPGVARSKILSHAISEGGQPISRVTRHPSCPVFGRRTSAGQHHPVGQNQDHP